MKKRLFPTILVLLAIQANSQKMTVKDSDNNVLMEVNDEGTVGSIVLDDSTVAPTTTTNKLYNVGGSLHWNGSALASGGSAWSLAGNVGTTPGTDFIGTTDNQALEIRVNNSRILRLEPMADSPNLLGGYSGNAVTAGVYGATISGGGTVGHVNRVTDDLGTVGGGNINQAGDGAGMTSDRYCATVGGGSQNTASGSYSTIGGGAGNTADGYISTVGGGHLNNTPGQWSTVPGGSSNRADGDYSLAAGRRARADHDGAFVWADATDADFSSSGANQFLIRASGGTGIGTASPQNMLDVSGSAVIGSGYAGSGAAPSNGLLVQGRVGIGKTGADAELDVNGEILSTYGFFHDRGDPSGHDKTAADWTMDGTWVDWDLSSVVPAGAKGIVIRGYVKSSQAGESFLARENGNSNEYNILQAITQAADIGVPFEGVVPCDAGRVIEYKFQNTGHWSDAVATVVGWIK